MNALKKLLRIVHGGLTGTHLCNNILVVAPIEHILRGFMFERTLEKHMYYFWRVVMPLYRPSNTVFLNYSLRIPNGEKFHIETEGLEEMANRISKIIQHGNLRYLRKIQRPKDFLEHISWMIGNTTRSFRLDLALTHYMIGNIGECKRILEELGSHSEMSDSKNDIVAALLGDLSTNPAIVAHRIEAWERTNIENLGLANSTVKMS